MESRPWRPLGLALRDYHRGDRTAQVMLRDLDGGGDGPLPAGMFFREVRGLPPVEATALSMARGRVLDVGAGAGAHALILQEQGLEVVALDAAPLAVTIMKERGVRDARLADLFSFDEGPFDTVLLLMNGVGIAESLDGLDHLLDHARSWITPDGQVLLDSSDLRLSTNPDEQRGMAQRRERGAFWGAVRFRMDYRGEEGEPFTWLFVDAETLTDHAERAGWTCQIVYEQDDGEYLARLTP